MSAHRIRRGRLARFLTASTLACASLRAPLASADCSSTHDADGLYVNAHLAFEQKRFDESVALLRRAYACEPNAIYLADIARTYEESHRPKDAVVAWREYLAAITDARDRAATRGRISALEKIVEDLDRLEREKAAAEEAKREAVASVPPEGVARVTRRVSTAAWIVTALGGVGLLGGATLGGLALAKHGSADATSSVTQAEALQSDAQTLAKVSTVSFIVGGSLAAAGLAWVGFDLLGGPRNTQATRLSVTAGMKELGVFGTF